MEGPVLMFMPVPELVLLTVPTPATCSALWRRVIIDAPVPGIAVAGIAVDTAAGFVGPTTTADSASRLLLLLSETKLRVWIGLLLLTIFVTLEAVSLLGSVISTSPPFARRL